MQSLPMDGVTVLAVILIASFAIDRITTGALIALSFIPLWKKKFPDPKTVSEPADKVQAENKQKLLYFLLAAVLGIGVLAWSGEIRLFTVLSFQINPALDALITGLILIAGADRVAVAIKMMGSGGGGSVNEAQTPIEITGKITLEQPGDKNSAP